MENWANVFQSDLFTQALSRFIRATSSSLKIKRATAQIHGSFSSLYAETTVHKCSWKIHMGKMLHSEGEKTFYDRLSANTSNQRVSMMRVKNHIYSVEMTRMEMYFDTHIIRGTTTGKVIFPIRV